MDRYQYIAQAVSEEADARLKQEPELRNKLRALYAVSTEIDLIIGQEMERLANGIPEGTT